MLERFMEKGLGIEAEHIYIWMQSTERLGKPTVWQKHDSGMTST